MQIFRSIQDQDVVAGMRHAKKYLVYVAPGVSAKVSEALVTCIQNKSADRFMIVLDADEETCRLGYCDAQSLKNLMECATKFKIVIRRQPGIRLGLLMSDDDVMIWMPTPLMFEAPRTGDETNGLILTPQTLSEMPAALGVDPEQPADKRQIGQTDLEQEAVNHVVEAIKAAPPAPFNLGYGQ